MAIGYQAVSKTGRLQYPVKINYEMDLSKMIALGNCDTFDSDITDQNFPVIGRGQVEVDLILFVFEYRIVTAEIIAEMDAEDCWPSKIEHLLAYNTKYPEVQKDIPISSLGSVWPISMNVSMVPTLDVSNYNHRSLKLDCANCVWDSGSGFLAVLKQPSA